MKVLSAPLDVVHSAQGKDVSDFQPVQISADWAGYQFGFSKATEGTSWKSQTFANNWTSMKAAKIHRGAYHFFHPSLDPIAQAEYFVSFVKSHGLEPGDMLMLDVEITVGFKNAVRRLFGRPTRNNLKQARLESSLVDMNARRCLDEIKRLVGPKNPVIIYTDFAVGQGLESCTGYPLWIAFYNLLAPVSVWPWKEWTFWQWTSTPIDSDAFNGPATELDAFILSYTSPAPPPAPNWHMVKADGQHSLGDMVHRHNTPLADAVYHTLAQPGLHSFLINYLIDAAAHYDVHLLPGTEVWVEF